jgi:hypothetical protein
MRQVKLKTAVLAGIALIGIGTITSCKSDKASLPKIGPYDNSNQVASANLLAHWTFDGTYAEEKSGKTPTTSVGASFTTGIKGQALHLVNGYLIYPTIPALSSANALSSVTVSMWVNVNNNGSKATSFFALTQPTSVQADWNQGPLNIYAETSKDPLTYNDTLVLHSAFHTYSGGNYNIGGDNINDYGVRGTDFQTVKGTNRWVHYVMQYNGNTSNIDLYADGVRVSNNNFRNRTTGTPPVGIGNIVMNTPTQVIIGGWPNSDAGYSLSAAQVWQGLMTGSIDEIRVYNTAIAETDIGYLYQLEKAGR